MPARETSPLGAPCWVDLSTADPAASKVFYSELFGWAVDDPGPAYGGYTNFTKDGAMIAGCMQHSPAMGAPPTWSVYLATADAEATANAAKDLGGEVIVPAMAVMELGTMAVFADPGGAAIGVWQPGLHQGFGLIAEAGAPSWFELHTRAYDASVAWYRDVFGWDTSVASDTPEFRYTTLGADEAAAAGVMDASAFPEGEPNHWAVYFGSDDVDASVAKVLELGGSVVHPAENTPYGRIACVTDDLGVEFRLHKA